MQVAPRVLRGRKLHWFVAAELIRRGRYRKRKNTIAGARESTLPIEDIREENRRARGAGGGGGGGGVGGFWIRKIKGMGSASAEN